MDASLRRELNDCISDLRRTSRQLRAAAEELEASMKGLGNMALADRMRRCADRYDRAANKLSRVR